MDPKERAYQCSGLPGLLLHDTISKSDALMLVCDIDPTNSYVPLFHERRHESVYNKVNDVVDFIATPPEIALLSEPTEYRIRTGQIESDDRSLIDSELERLRSVLVLDDFGDPFFLYDGDGADDVRQLKKQIASRRAALDKLELVLSVFDSNPANASKTRLTVNELVEWAKTKNFELPWLDWAVQNGFVDSATFGPIDSTRSEEQILKPKKEETYQCVIGALISVLKNASQDARLARRVKTQDGIISAIHDCLGEHHGLSESSLKEYFRDANRALGRRKKS